MKRFSFIIAVLTTLLIVPHVFAADPLLAQASTPETSSLPPESTWTIGDCEGVAKPGDPPCKIAPDIADDRIVNEQTTPACKYDEEGFLACITQTIHSWLLGYQAASDYKTPAYDKIGNWLQGADVKLNPSLVAETTLDNTNPQYESHATRRCIYDEKGVLQKDSNKVSNEIITIGPIYGIPRVVQYADTMSQRYSLAQKSPDEEGFFDYEHKTEIIDKTQAHDCDYSRTGTPLPVPTPQSTQGRIAFDVFAIPLSIANAVLGSVFKSTEVVVASKRTPNAEDMMGLSGQVTQSDLADSPVSDIKKTKLVETPGFIETFRPGSLSYRPENINGSIINSFTGEGISQNNTNTYMTNMLDRSYNFLCSTLFPATILPEECKIDLTSIESCDTSALPDFSTTGACGLCNPDRINEKAINPLPATFREGMPPTLKAMLEKLGEVFKVPPASILATLQPEGGLHATFTGENAWINDNVEKWIMCTASMPSKECKDPQSISAAVCGPGGSDPNSTRCFDSIEGFGWLPHWFWYGDENSAPWSAVLKIDPTRSKETISPCNLLDAAAATAKALSLQTIAPLPDKIASPCFGIDLTDVRLPTSCSNWTDNTVFRSHVGYSGYCPQTGKSGEYPPNDAFEGMVMGWYKVFSCGN